MGQMAYQFVVLMVYVAAALDVLQLKPASPTAARSLGARPMHKLAHRIALVWFAFQAVCLVSFALSGDLHRAMPSAVLYITNSMTLFLIVPAGIIWSFRATVPIFPLMRRRKFSVRHPAVVFAILAAASTGLTAAVVLFANWKPDSKLDAALETSGHSHFANALFALYLLISAPIAEEFVFRHYLQNRLMALNRSALYRLLAIVLVAAVFALGHGGMISPAWVKYAQVFGFGLALGVCQMTLGIECCIGLHLFFNLGAAVMGMLHGQS